MTGAGSGAAGVLGAPRKKPKRRESNPPLGAGVTYWTGAGAGVGEGRATGVGATSGRGTIGAGWSGVKPLTAAS